MTAQPLNDERRALCPPLRFRRDQPGGSFKSDRSLGEKKNARDKRPREADPLHKSALLMAAPSGLTRFTTPLCVGPLPVLIAGDPCSQDTSIVDGGGRRANGS